MCLRWGKTTKMPLGGAANVSSTATRRPEVISASTSQVLRQAMPQPPRHQSCSTWPSEDRKSTRLNSSHLVISYAVFCLKKKKQETARNFVLFVFRVARQTQDLHTILQLLRNRMQHVRRRDEHHL